MVLQSNPRVTEFVANFVISANPFQLCLVIPRLTNDELHQLGAELYQNMDELDFNATQVVEEIRHRELNLRRYAN